MAAHLLPQSVGDRRRRGRRPRATRCGGAGRCSTGNSATTRPGRLESSTTRSPRRTASRTLWVTNSTVRPVLAPEPLELVVQQVAGHGVERAERLVHEQHVGLLRERAGQLHPLAHAARQLVGQLLLEALEVDELEQLAHALPAGVGLRHLAELERELDVAPHGEPREQRRLLEHERRATAAHRRPCPAVGRSSPATRLSSVLLPQPDAPSRHTNSPGATSSETAVERGHRVAGVAEHLGDACRARWRRASRDPGRGDPSGAARRRVDERHDRRHGACTSL